MSQQPSSPILSPLDEASRLIREFNKLLPLIDRSCYDFPGHVICYRCERVVFNELSHYLHPSKRQQEDYFCSDCVAHCKYCDKYYSIDRTGIHSKEKCGPTVSDHDDHQWWDGGD